MKTTKRVCVKPSKAVAKKTRMDIPTNPNPLLIDVPLQIIFQNLRVDDLKRCRLVCQQWNKNAALYLNRRTIINFRGGNSRQLKTYQKIMKGRPLSVLPSSFKFEYKTLSKSEMYMFFKKFGKGIQYLNFEHIRLKSESNPSLERYDITPWLTRTSNLQELLLHTLTFQLETPLELLRPIPRLCLNRSTIKVDEFCNNQNRLTPLKVSLQNVQFKQQDKILINATLNNFFNFSAVKEICITQEETVFDLSVDVFNAKCVVLKDWSKDQSRFINWKDCTGSVDFLYLDRINIREATQLQVKELQICNGNFSLSALPKSIEKIHIDSGCGINFGPPMKFPKLKYLKVDFLDHIISGFKDCCGNSLELEFHSYCNASSKILKLDSLPYCVKKLKLQGQVSVEGHGHIVVDTLILQDPDIKMVEQIICKIKPTNLVLSYQYVTDTIKSFDFRALISRNSHLKKVAIGIHSGRLFNYLFTPEKSVITVNEFAKLEDLDHMDERSHETILMYR